MVDIVPEKARKGRGAAGNPAGRFDVSWRVPVDDGWTPDEDVPPLRTVLTPDSARSVIARNNSPDVGFDRSINPYRGCEHGCVYCFARPSHSYLGLSPGLDFETNIFFKKDAAKRLEKELRRPTYLCAPMALGVNTDAYQPTERKLGITRSILEVLDAFNHPVSLVTKSAAVVRDVDILARMARRNLAQVMVSVTTLDGALARRMEPRAPAPARRIATVRALIDAGVPTGVLVAPMIPALNDTELENILEAARGAGALAAGYVFLRLPHELKGLFEAWLDNHYPERKGRVLKLIRDARGGRLNAARFGERMSGTGVYAGMLSSRFDSACRRLGLADHLPVLDNRSFRSPPRAGDQLSLL
jgi:DNA repair photolyase